MSVLLLKATSINQLNYQIYSNSPACIFRLEHFRKYRYCYHHSQSSALSAALACGVRGNRSHVFNTSNLNPITGNRAKSRLSPRSRSFVPCSSSGAQLDVNGSDVQLLEPVHDVDGGLHGCVGRRLVTISLHFHTSCNSCEGFSTSEVSHVDKGVVPGGQDVADSEDVSRSILGSKRPLQLGLRSLLDFFFSFGWLLLVILCVFSDGNFCLSLLDFSHISNQYFRNNQYFINNWGLLRPPYIQRGGSVVHFADNNLLMISTRKSAQGLLQTLKYSKVNWTTGNPYNVRWQYKWRPAYYTYLKDGYEPTHTVKPEDTVSVRPPFYTYVQDFLYRVFPGLKTIYNRSQRFQDPFQIYVLPSLSLFFYQFWDLDVGFKGLTILPWMLFWTRIRDKTLDPDINEVHLRDILHQNPQIGALFKPQSIHLLDYELDYETGYLDEKKFPQFKNGYFRFFNNDTHLTTGFFKFGDLQSGATMTLHVKTMPTHGEFRYQVGEPFYFYSVRAEVVHNGELKQVVLVDEAVELKKKRPFLIII